MTVNFPDRYAAPKVGGRLEADFADFVQGQGGPRVGVQVVDTRRKGTLARVLGMFGIAAPEAGSDGIIVVPEGADLAAIIQAAKRTAERCLFIVRGGGGCG